MADRKSRWNNDEKICVAPRTVIWEEPIWDMPGGDQPGTNPGIRDLEATVRDLLTHAGGTAEALRMNVMSTISRRVHAADTPSHG